MYVNNYTLPTPPQELLDRCYQVDFDGEGRFMSKMRRWCYDHTESFVWADRIDMSDLSSWTGPDDYCKFYFYKEADATLFSLKWL